MFELLDLKRFLEKITNTTVLGEIKLYSGTTVSVPNGWLLCDGYEYNISDYPELNDLFGGDSKNNVSATRYGTASTGKFKVPDLRGRVPVGVNASDAIHGNNPSYSTRGLGGTGGAEGVVLTSTSQIPAHTHGEESLTGSLTLRKWGTSGHAYGGRSGIITIGTESSATGYPFATGSGSTPKLDTIQVNASHTHNSVGGTDSHNNMQPWIGLNYIIYVGR